MKSGRRNLRLALHANAGRCLVVRDYCDEQSPAKPRAHPTASTANYTNHYRARNATMTYYKNLCCWLLVARRTGNCWGHTRYGGEILLQSSHYTNYNEKGKISGALQFPACESCLIALYTIPKAVNQYLTQALGPVPVIRVTTVKALRDYVKICCIRARCYGKFRRRNRFSALMFSDLSFMVRGYHYWKHCNYIVLVHY
jgi:hypothetical protein